MDLKSLKKTWNKLPSEGQLDEDQLRKMLSKQTKSLMDRIDRNIKIGFVVLFGMIVLFAFDDFILSPQLIKEINEDISIPNWLIFFGVFSNVLIFTTFIYFVIKYYLVKRKCDFACNLYDTLNKIIETLILYQRLFYLALFALLFAIGSAFVTGMYEGFSAGITDKGQHFADVETTKLLVAILIGVLFLVIFIGGIFLILRWGFRKLYGNYINKLKLTLKELQEIEE